MPVHKVKGGFKCGNLSKEPLSEEKAKAQCAAYHANKKKKKPGKRK